MCANLSVPAQHRFGLYNEERGLPAAEPATRQNPETPVHILKARPRLAALQDYQLLPEAKIVCDQQRLRLDSRSKRPQKTPKHCLSPCCRTARRLMLINAVNGNGPCGSQFCALQEFDYGEPVEAYPPERRAGYEAMIARAAALGEPWLSFFVPQKLASALSAIGYGKIEDLSPRNIAMRY